MTPLFPDGLTVIDGKGQFRPSADKDASDRVGQIRSRCKARFQQQSVLRVDEPACASF
jgi:hypothetical protein